MKVSYQVYDTAGGPPVLLFKSDNIQSFIVSNFVISSASGNQTTCSIYLVPPNTASPAQAKYAVLNGYKLAANSYVEGHGGFVVPSGGYAVYVSTDTGSAVVYTVSGDLGPNN